MWSFQPLMEIGRVRSEYCLLIDSESLRVLPNAENRAKFLLRKIRHHQCRLFIPFIDFNNLDLKLPGFSIRD